MMGHNLSKLIVLFSLGIITFALSSGEVFAQHEHSSEPASAGAFVGLDDSHVPIDTTMLYSCEGCVTNPKTQTLTIFKFKHDDMPFLTGGATYLISPNPYAFTTFADDLPAQLFGPNLIITDNDPLDADPTLGVLELTGVNEGVYSVWEIYGPPGLIRNNLPQATDEITLTSYPHVGITNIFLEASQTSSPQLMVPRPIPQNNLNTMNSFGATINGNPLSGDQMPGSFIVNNANKYSGNPPSSILFSDPVDPSWSTEQLFSNLGIPTYNGPTNMEDGNLALIPPIFIAPNPDGGHFLMSPVFDQVSPGTNLVLRLDGVEHTHHGSSIRGLNLPLAVGGTDVGLSVLMHHSPPASAPDLDPEEGTQVLFIEVSNVGDLNINEQSIFSENPTIDFYLNKNSDGACPASVIVYLLHNAGTPSAHWAPVEIGGHAHGPSRDPPSDTATQCAYVQETEHFSSYLVGTGGSGGLGGGHDDHGSGGSGSGGTGTGGHTDHGTSSSGSGGSGGHGGHGGHGGTSGGTMEHGFGGIIKKYPHQETITLITNQLNIFSIKYDLNQKIAWILAGTTGKPEHLAIETHGRQGGIVTAKLSSDQPYEQENQQYSMKRYLFEVPLSPIESYIRVSADDPDYQLVQSVNIKEKIGEVIPWYASLTHGLLGDTSEHDMSSHEGMLEHESMDMDTIESLVDESGFGIKFEGHTSSVQFEDQKFSIVHTEGAHITGIQVDEQLQGVLFFLEHAEQGEFTIKFPRNLVDAQINDFIVFANDSPEQQIAYEVVGSDPESFTMTLDLPADTSSLTIVGSSVVPEFGQIAALILIAGIIPIILLGKNSLFSIKV